MKRVLITGASGALGQVLTPYLHKRGYEVFAVAHHPEKLADSLVPVFSIDIKRQETFNQLPQKIDVVIHAAAQKQGAEETIEAISELMVINILGTLNTLKYAMESGVKKIIYCSTLSVYALPQKLPIAEEGITYPTTTLDSYYGISKLTGELLLEKMRRVNKIQSISLRLGRIYGVAEKEGSLLHEWRNKARAGQEIVVFGNGERSLDFIHIQDVLTGIERAIEWEGAGGVFNLSSGCEIRWRELAEAFVKVYGANPNSIRYVEEGLRTRCYLDISRARKILGFSPSISL